MTKRKKITSTSSQGKSRFTRSKIIKYFLALIVWGILGVMLLVGWHAYNLPGIQDLKIKPRQPSIVFLTANHQEIAVQGDVYGEPVTVKKVPKALIQALLATEDRHFYSHWGVDFTGIIRATLMNLLRGRYAQGGSTITQQLAKNLFLSPDRSIDRKIKEMILAWKLEYYFSKEEILNIYLNRVYLGNKTYGVDAAAQQYFGKLASHLSTAQCAVIVGLLKAPSRISRTSEALKQRGKVVLRNMVEAGYLTEAQYTVQAQKIDAMVFHLNTFGNNHRYFTDWIISEAEKLIGDQAIAQDLIITTTVNLPLQNKAVQILRARVDEWREHYKVSQAAFVALDYDGAVRVLIGGYNYNTSQFNVAFQGYRQPGSTFKIFVYLAALEAGMSPDMLLSDAPYRNKQWTVHDYKYTAQGQVTMEQAFVKSVNTATVRLAQKVGVKPIVYMAERFGFKSLPEANLSISLGTSQVTLLEMVSMMAALANGGTVIKPYGILEIRSSDGKILYQREPTLASAEGVKEFDSAVLEKINDFLEKTVTEGRGKNAAIPGVRVRGKTGTTQKFRDAWFIGYTPDLVAGVWMGNHDETPMNQVSGGLLPAKLWRSIMAP